MFKMEKQNIVEDRKTSIVHAFTCIPEIKVVVGISILNILNSTVKSIIKSYRYYGNYMIGYNKNYKIFQFQFQIDLSG